MTLSFLKKKNTKKIVLHKRSLVREWVNSLGFAIITATVLRWLVIELYTIPSSSMEKTLLTGDFVLVSKMHYGARTPKTLLQIPLTHQKIQSFNLKSYLSWIQLPLYRLPGFSKIQRYDNIVFNTPIELDVPTDLRTLFIKRCIGLPGDELCIKNQEVYINNELIRSFPGVQYQYFLITRRTLNKQFFEKYGIQTYRTLILNRGYEIYATTETMLQLSKLTGVTMSPVVQLQDMREQGIHPNSPIFCWNRDFFGPLKIPGKGVKVVINKESLVLYQKIIKKFEGHKDIEIKDNQLWIDGNHIQEYTFRNNYYFMLGDNRNNSSDSRFWGFVPEDHIVGKAVMVLYSLDLTKNFFSKVRLKRLCKWVH